MEYVAFAFGIFGLCAFLELSSLKGRISKLEEQLTKTEGTSYHLNRQELLLWSPHLQDGTRRRSPCGSSLPGATPLLP